MKIMGLSFIGGLRPQLPKDRAHENNIVYHPYQKYSFRLSFPWKECGFKSQGLWSS